MLSKSEKEFWLKEIGDELDLKIEPYTDDIERCFELAKGEALKSTGVDKRWLQLQRAAELADKAYQTYKDIEEELTDLLREVNKELKKYTYEVIEYDKYKRLYNIEINWASPNSYRAKENETHGLSTSWIDTLAKHFFFEKMLESQGVTAPLEVKRLKKKLERGIMLATTTTQLREFLNGFMAENEIEP